MVVQIQFICKKLNKKLFWWLSTVMLLHKLVSMTTLQWRHETRCMTKRMLTGKTGSVLIAAKISNRFPYHFCWHEKRKISPSWYDVETLPHHELNPLIMTFVGKDVTNCIRCYNACRPLYLPSPSLLLKEVEHFFTSTA